MSCSIYFHEMKFMDKDRNPDTELAKKVFEFYSGEDSEFAENWELDGGTLRTTCEDYERSENFAEEVFEKFNPVKFQDLITEENNHHNDYFSKIDVNNGNASRLLNKNYVNFSLINCQLNSDGDEFADDYYSDDSGKVYSKYYGRYVEVKGNYVSIDDEGYLGVKKDYNTFQRFTNEDGDFIKEPYTVENEEVFLESGDEAEEAVIKGDFKISYYKKDPANKTALEELDKEFEQIANAKSHTTDFVKGMIFFEVKGATLRAIFDKVASKYNTFNFRVQAEGGYPISYNHGECTFDGTQDLGF